jgi:hypothetical protein
MQMPLLGPAQPKAIAMWDFSWLERRWDGAGYEDWAKALDELAERGYDAVRIDAFPHLIAAGAEAEYTLVPVWDQHDWGSPTQVGVTVTPALTEFIALAADRNIAVALSSWFRQDVDNVRLRLDTPEKFAQAWIDTLSLIDNAGLLHAIWYVDLCNEWASPMWAPFVYPTEVVPGMAPLQRTSDRVRDWTSRALTTVRSAYPALPLCFSFSDNLSDWRAEDVHEFDLIEPHVWMADDVTTGFYAELGYNMTDALFDPSEYDRLAGAPDLYASDPQLWQTILRGKIADMAEWSRTSGIPLVTTECWAIVNWKDGEKLDWEWLKTLCAYGVDEAIATRRWVGIATSNFCGPQYVGMWSDVAWHQSLTTRIRTSSPACLGH